MLGRPSTDGLQRAEVIATTSPASWKAIDDFAASSPDPKVHARILGLDE
jgi:hypothetical protein